MKSLTCKNHTAYGVLIKRKCAHIRDWIGNKLLYLRADMLLGTHAYTCTYVLNNDVCCLIRNQFLYRYNDIMFIHMCLITSMHL